LNNARDEEGNLIGPDPWSVGLGGSQSEVEISDDNEEDDGEIEDEDPLSSEASTHNIQGKILHIHPVLVVLCFLFERFVKVSLSEIHVMIA